MQLDLSSFNWKQSRLFNDIAEADCRRVMSSGFYFQYEAGSTLLSNRDEGETFFFIFKGMAKLLLENARKETVNVTLFVPGDFFGEMAILDPTSARSGNIVAITNLEVITLHKTEFLKVLNGHAQLSLNLARCMANRLRVMNERLVTDALPKPINKISHTLMLLSSKGRCHPDTGHIIMPPLSVQEWALFCYTSPEVFRTNLDMLKHMGAVDMVNHQLVVTDISKLASIAKG